jgi:hypothetical protein
MDSQRLGDVVKNLRRDVASAFLVEDWETRERAMDTEESRRETEANTDEDAERENGQARVRELGNVRAGVGVLRYLDYLASATRNLVTQTRGQPSRRTLSKHYTGVFLTFEHVKRLVLARIRELPQFVSHLPVQRIELLYPNYCLQHLGCACTWSDQGSRGKFA